MRTSIRLSQLGLSDLERCLKFTRLWSSKCSIEAWRHKVTREGYRQAYQKGFDLTVRFLLSRGAWRDNASEVAQAAWVRGWERLDQLRNERLVLTWVNTIALNLYRSVLRKDPPDQLLPDFKDKAEGVNLAAIDVARVIALCSPLQRDLLEHCMLGATTREIAERHGLSETAVRIRLLRTRRHLRSRIELRRTPALQTSRQAA